MYIKVLKMAKPLKLNFNMEKIQCFNCECEHCSKTGQCLHKDFDDTICPVDAKENRNDYIESIIK